MIPVPGHAIGTPYGARSSLWSCRKDIYGRGIHTGVDFPADVGTHVVAARAGTVVWVDHGWYFGYHQMEINCSDGTADFYAHMTGRVVKPGQYVDAGQHVGYVGAEGHVTGPHLHFERHACQNCSWSCSIVRDPVYSINYQSKEVDMPLNKDDLDKIKRIVRTEVDAVFDQPVNLLSGKTGEDLFIGMSFRDLLKGLYRKIKS